MKRTLKLIIFPIIIIVILLFIWSILNNKQVYLSQDIDVSSLKQIAVISNGFDIDVQPTSNTKLTFRIVGRAEKSYGKQLKINAKTQDELLALSYTNGKEKSFLTPFFPRNSLKLEVLVPMKDWDKLTLDSKSGDITAEAMAGKDLSLNSTSGNITLSNTTANNLTIQSDAGDQDVTNSAADNISLSSTSGKMTYDSITADLLIALSSSGDKVMKSLESDSITIKSTSGINNIQIVAGLAAEFSSTSGDTKIDSDELLQTVYAKTTSGNFKMTTHDSVENLLLKTKQTSGNLSTNIDAIHVEKQTNKIGSGSNIFDISTTSGDIIFKEK